VTVLFCDVKGSTTLAESLDPEEWTEIMNGAFAALIEPISRYEGTVVRLLGDAILAFFGAPTAHEDDPERAVLAGLEMLQALNGYRTRLRSERGIAEFDIRIGVNTGLAILGDVGSGQRVEYTAMGDAVNVAARLQAAAAPGTVVIGEATGRVVATLFELRSLGTVELKGRSEPVEAFEVIRRAATRGDRRGLGRRVPVVGRDSEMSLLRATLDEVRAGHGRVVALIGEPGIGKSRLIDELRGSWHAGTGAGEAALWTDARCESYTGSQAYLTFRSIIRDSLRLIDHEAPSPVLQSLLGTAELAATGLDGEQLAAEIRRQVSEVVRRVSERGPLVIAVDDLHWSDPASVDLLIEMLALTDELPVLFLTGLRPDRRAAGWKLKQSAESDYPHRYREVVLSSLRREDGGSLIARVLDPNELPAALCELVTVKADGNPFFLEEILRSLIDRGTIRRDPAGVWRADPGAVDLPLPGSVQSLLASRIDRLDESARRTLQAASVIGRTFPYRVLGDVAEAGARLDKDLATLQRFELVSETARLPEREYTFRHALTQDAAYASMLQRRRRELHVRVAEALLARRGDQLDEQAGVIGRHFAQADDPRAVALLVLAGDHARRLYALEEALVQYDLALSHAGAAEPALVGRLYEGRGRTLELRGDHDAAIANYEALRRIGVERGARELEGNALAMLASIYSTATARRDVAKAEELLASALDIARERGDRMLVAKLQESRMWLSYFEGDLAAALAAGEEAVAIDRELGRTEDLAVALNNVSHVYRDLYRFADAEAVGAEASGLFRAAGNKSMLADSLSTRSQALICVGDYDAVERHAEEARRLSEEAKNDWGRSYAEFVTPLLRYDRGAVGEAIQSWRGCVEDARRGGFVSAEVGPQSELAGIFAEVGAFDLATFHIDAAIDVSRRILPQWLKWPLARRIRIDLARGVLDRAYADLAEIDRLPPGLDRFPFVPAQVALARASVALAAGDAARARVIAADARSAFNRAGILPWQVDLAFLEGQALSAQGDVEGARVAFERARHVAERLGSRRMLWRIHAALGERERARQIVAGIAASLDQVGLREGFIALPDVGGLLA
jgi:class 3 adenylate cyclase/tetratricopeptide (TPR) repeat protein